MTFFNNQGFPLTIFGAVSQFQMPHCPDEDYIPRCSDPPWRTQITTIHADMLKLARFTQTVPIELQPCTASAVPKQTSEPQKGHGAISRFKKSTAKTSTQSAPELRPSDYTPPISRTLSEYLHEYNRIKRQQRVRGR